jgi:hypothetical protein
MWMTRKIFQVSNKQMPLRLQLESGSFVFMWDRRFAGLVYR